MRGFFVVLEGIEGSGKSTLAKSLVKILEDHGHDVLYTREPGGTRVGEGIRVLLLSPELDLSPWTEFFLFLAARREHTFSVIRPSLARGKIVISDRFYLSSFAYQGYGRGLPLKPLSRLNKLATGGLVPHLTVVVDLPVEVALSRLKGQKDRFEKQDVAFHKRVREGYLKMAKRAGKRIRVVDGARPLEEVLAEVQDLVIKGLEMRKGVRS